MVHWDLPRTPASIGLLVRLGAERGLAEEALLGGTGLRREVLDDPRGEVRPAEELRVIANLVEALDDPPGLGIEAGVRYHLTTYGIWGFALISSPTGRSAIATGLRYLDLTFALCDIRADEGTDDLRLVLAAPDIPHRLRRFVTERDAAAIQTIQRELFGQPFPVRRISFAFPPPDRVDRFVEVFGVEPEFNAPRTEALVDPALLDQPLPQADVHTTTVAQQQCEELLSRRQARAGVAGRVRSLLLERPADPPSECEVASMLHMSDRTLRHHLAGEGTTYRSLLDEVRERLAEELLVTGGLSVTEVARRLGYLEVSSFSQAFRRWKGVGPRAYLARTGIRPAAPRSPSPPAPR